MEQQPKQEIKVIRKIILKKVKAPPEVASAPANEVAQEVASAPEVPSAQTKVVAQTQVVAKTEEELINLYIEQLSPQEKIVLKIAREHLQSSFCIEKSLGFLEWCKKYLTK